eukprot:TRINITY_DN9112_c0_g1_i1.p1 TRINITY_DN9112_c0_g1~~TRINITY_DN9112_c0_g1_i1.p1  ORF type:complete len:1065 (-),score=254.27 TRINITY_DN9112_c0_g1_i1:458-3652(-)
MTRSMLVVTVAVLLACSGIVTAAPLNDVISQKATQEMLSKHQGHLESSQITAETTRAALKSLHHVVGRISREGVGADPVQHHLEQVEKVKAAVAAVVSSVRGTHPSMSLLEDVKASVSAAVTSVSAVQAPVASQDAAAVATAAVAAATIHATRPMSQGTGLNLLQTCDISSMTRCTETYSACVQSAGSDVSKICSCVDTFFSRCLSSSCLALIAQQGLDCSQLAAVCPAVSCPSSGTSSGTTTSTPSPSSSSTPPPTSGGTCDISSMTRCTETYSACVQSAGSDVSKICSCVDTFFSRCLSSSCLALIAQQGLDCSQLAAVCPAVSCPSSTGTSSPATSSSSTPSPPTSTGTCDISGMTQCTETYSTCVQSAGQDIPKLCACTETFLHKCLSSSCFELLISKGSFDCSQLTSFCPNIKCSVSSGGTSSSTPAPTSSTGGACSDIGSTITSCWNGVNSGKAACLGFEPLSGGDIPLASDTPCECLPDFTQCLKTSLPSTCTSSIDFVRGCRVFLQKTQCGDECEKFVSGVTGDTTHESPKPITPECLSALSAYSQSGSEKECEPAFNLENTAITSSARETLMCAPDTGCIAKLQSVFKVCATDLKTLDPSGQLDKVAHILAAFQLLCPSTPGGSDGCFADAATYESRAAQLSFDQGTSPSQEEIKALCTARCTKRIHKFHLAVLGAVGDRQAIEDAKAGIEARAIACVKGQDGRYCYPDLLKVVGDKFEASAICPKPCVRRAFLKLTHTFGSAALRADYKQFFKFVCAKKDSVYCNDIMNEIIASFENGGNGATTASASATPAPARLLSALPATRLTSKSPFKLAQTDSDPCAGLQSGTCSSTCAAVVNPVMTKLGCCAAVMVRTMSQTRADGPFKGYRDFANAAKMAKNCGSTVQVTRAAECVKAGRVQGSLGMKGLKKETVDANQLAFYANLTNDLQEGTGVDGDDISIDGYEENKASSRLRALQNDGVTFKYTIRTEDQKSASAVSSDFSSELASGDLELASTSSEIVTADPAAASSVAVDTSTSSTQDTSGSLNNSGNQVALTMGYVLVLAIAAIFAAVAL